MSDRNEEMGRLAAREQQNEEENEEEQEESESVDADDASTGEDTPQRPESAEDTDTPPESDTGESGAERAPINVKDREETLFAYLPERLDRQIETACQSVSLTYQRESGEKLGKNRYLYPIVLMVGADNAVDLSAEEIRDLVERIDDVEDAS